MEALVFELNERNIMKILILKQLRLQVVLLSATMPSLGCIQSLWTQDASRCTLMKNMFPA